MTGLLRLLSLLAIVALPASAFAQADSVVMLASAARTADASSSLVYPPGWARGMIVLLDLTAGSGFNVEVGLQLDLGGGVTVDLYDVGVPQTTTSLYCVHVHPGGIFNSLAGACADDSLPMPVPKKFRLIVDHADATSVTYSLSIIWTR